MDIKNSTLDDICGCIGFSATLRLAAWFGDLGNLYVPEKTDEDSILEKLLGKTAAQKMCAEWGGEYLAVPGIASYEEDVKRRLVGSLIARGHPTQEIRRIVNLGERRVQQIGRELETLGLIPVIAPRRGAGRAEVVGDHDEGGCDGV